jgi:hypothetical protein
VKVWISKHALTNGAVDQRIGDPTDHGAFYVERSEFSAAEYYRRGEWHETYEQAVERAEVMRLAKIRSYEKRLKQLKAMKFEVKE